MALEEEEPGASSAVVGWAVAPTGVVKVEVARAVVVKEVVMVEC